MSRIKKQPFDEQCAGTFGDNLDLDGVPEEVLIGSVVVYAVVVLSIILLLQYCVLRCSNAVKKENIFNFLFIGTLTTFFVSVVSITFFWEETLHFMEDQLDKL